MNNILSEIENGSLDFIYDEDRAMASFEQLEQVYDRLSKEVDSNGIVEYKNKDLDDLANVRGINDALSALKNGITIDMIKNDLNDVSDKITNAYAEVNKTFQAIILYNEISNNQGTAFDEDFYSRLGTLDIAYANSIYDSLVPYTEEEKKKQVLGIIKKLLTGSFILTNQSENNQRKSKDFNYRRSSGGGGVQQTSVSTPTSASSSSNPDNSENTQVTNPIPVNNSAAKETLENNTKDENITKVSIDKIQENNTNSQPAKSNSNNSSGILNSLNNDFIKTSNASSASDNKENLNSADKSKNNILEKAISGRLKSSVTNVNASIFDATTNKRPSKIISMNNIASENTKKSALPPVAGILGATIAGAGTKGAISNTKYSFQNKTKKENIREKNLNNNFKEDIIYTKESLLNSLLDEDNNQ